MKDYLITIRTKEERDAGHPLFDIPAVATEMDLIGVGVDEAATDSRKTGVVMAFKMPGSQVVKVVSMTAAAYLTIAAGIKGAMERFGDPWTGA